MKFRQEILTGMLFVIMTGFSGWDAFLLAQEQPKSDAKNLDIAWEAESQNRSDSIFFALNFYFDSDDKALNTESITVFNSSGDRAFDSEIAASVTEIFKQMCFDEEAKPLTKSCSQNDSIHVGATCKVTIIDKKTHLLVVHICRFGPALLKTETSGIFLLEDGALSTVIRKPNNFHGFYSK